jgi:hypothetical protein
MFCDTRLWYSVLYTAMPSDIPSSYDARVIASQLPYEYGPVAERVIRSTLPLYTLRAYLETSDSDLKASIVAAMRKIYPEVATHACVYTEGR